MENIHDDGYMLLSNQFTPNELQFGLSSVKDDKINYHTMKQFVDHVFFPKIIDKSGVITETLYVKFRFSNNSNALDASTFHGDIYNHTQSKLLPIYTCLCYFDEAKLEVIPGSHKYNNRGNSMESYHKKEVLDLKPGDILIFHSNLHHRGIGYYQQENRRVLQVFEVFPDKKTYDENISKVVIVTSNDSPVMKKFVGPFLYKVSQQPYLIDQVTKIHYWFMFNDLHYKVGLLDIPPNEKKNKYVSYESGKRLLYENVRPQEDLNINIICDKQATSITFSHYYLYMFIMFVLIVVTIFYVIRNQRLPRKSRSKRN